MKQITWVASSQKDLRACPDEVRQSVGYALYVAQRGDKADIAKVMKGFGSANVVEIVVKMPDDTYRAVYTVECQDMIYVLHVFQKKSHKGSETPKPDANLIRQRLSTARSLEKEKRKS